MKIRQYILLLFLIYSYIPGLAQVDTAWVRRYNGPGNSLDLAYALAVDSAGNVYVTGNTATIKYLPNGDTAWVRTGYEGNAISLDDNANVYVAGNLATIKYLPNGDTAWLRADGVSGNGITVDDSGSVYVSGRSDSGTSYDYATIKYDSEGGTLWVRRYNGPGNDWDETHALVVDASGNVYVTGESYDSVTHRDYATIKYDSYGDTLWVRRYNGPGDYNDVACALAVDDLGNVYVTGRSGGDGTSYDYATIKYDSDGETLWVRRYNGPGNDWDEARALVVDASGNVYVTGESYGSGTNRDYTTVKYNSDGDTPWVRRYNGPGDIDDDAYALAVDASSNVYITGTGTSYDYATIKYAPNGDTLWVRHYDGPRNWGDIAYALKVDDLGNVYVTGGSVGIGTFYDYATIKYVQFTCLAKPGDATGDNNILLTDIVRMINYLFKDEPLSDPYCRADANANGIVTFPDIIYLVNFLFKSGPAPIKSNECCL